MPPAMTTFVHAYVVLTNRLVSWLGRHASPRTASSPPPPSNSPRAASPARASTASPAAPASTRRCSTTTSSSKQGLYRALLREIFAAPPSACEPSPRSGAPPADKLDRVIAAHRRVHPASTQFFPAIMLREVAEGGAHLDRRDAHRARRRSAHRRRHRRSEASPTERSGRSIPLAAYFSMLAPIVFYLAGAPIRRELATRHVVNMRRRSTDDVRPAGSGHRCAARSSATAMVTRGWTR